MPNFGQDLDIGRPTIVNLTKPVEVENLAGVVAAINETTSKIEEITAEVEKMRKGIDIGVTDLNSDELEDS